jgi:hypothetical protein
MYIRKPNPRAWAVIPAVVLVVAISVIAGPANAATYATQVPLGAARSFAVLAPVAELVEPTVVTAVGTTALQIPVAVTTVQRLPATSTSDTSGEPMLLGFLIGLLGTLLIFGSRKALIQRVINIYTR